ncbi:MAG: Trk family potassium uptake protein [Chloroflexi bacterium]|nr:Trk family potassium uptake protein [Chloroflexota bacterium]
MTDYSRGKLPRGYRRKAADRFYRVQRQKPWRVLLPPAVRKTGPRASLATLAYGFAGMIVLGTLLLTLPISSRSGQPTALVDAFFTATSAVCVTGLVVVDTLDHWNFFGQLVILALIQLGGFGYMTMTTLVLMTLGRRIGLRERLLVGESIGLFRLGGIVSLVRNMAFFALSAEAIGAVLFYLRFSTEYPGGAAIWKSIFHSVSAFNNAGFDIFGGFISLTGYSNDYLVLLVTAALVITGGISFLVVQDVFSKRRPSRFSTDTRMILSVTLALLALGTVMVLTTEYNNGATIGAMPDVDRVINAFFQSVTARTAGFNAIDTAMLADQTLFFVMLLMFIGGASGSTAGGIKVNTLGLIVATVWSTMRGREHPGAYGREFMIAQILRALSVLVLSLGIMAFVVFTLTITEDARFLDILFEAVSAFGTVGLTTGVTPALSVIGRLVIIAAMFVGRLGPLTLTLALVKVQQPSIYRRPKEIIRIG